MFRSTAPPAGEQGGPAPIRISLQAPAQALPGPATDRPVPRPSDGSEDPSLVTLPAASASAEPSAAEAEDDLAIIRRVVEESRARLAGINTYQVSMNRQERVGEALLPTEDVQLSIRHNPLAVRLEWLDGPNKGREVIYNAGGLMQVYMPGSLVSRISLPPDSPLALRNSRHPITEAGLSHLIAEIDAPLRLAEAGQGADRLTYEGLEAPEPGAPACHKIVRVTPTGEAWTVYVDPATKLPYLVHAVDPGGQLLERYIFRNPQIDLVELAATDAFDPDSRWGRSGGLLGRLARSDRPDDRKPATAPPR